MVEFLNDTAQKVAIMAFSHYREFVKNSTMLHVLMPKGLMEIQTRVT